MVTRGRPTSFMGLGLLIIVPVPNPVHVGERARRRVSRRDPENVRTDFGGAR
ncbi:hypothetical protein NEOLEDRAFT_1136167 [Neolentinus lepideus HHB14362 ss-1]|uniref:Uncharacterized protein n=1 Tax=Neolentinus lepideus HHB14362 ss-1 TaxID=1314782 RepID=A0A165RDV5_9AGAM|nr:hypothetical protein NEOLEDRAFT_1136167 [Neolentinus lepideus HHB14362 ss-1]